MSLLMTFTSSLLTLIRVSNSTSTPSILLIWTLTSGPTIMIPSSTNVGPDAEADMAPCPRAYKRVKKGLKVMLRNEVEAYGRRLSSAGIGQLVQQAKSVKVIVEEFSPQLLSYSRGEYPFTDPVGSKTVLEWWEGLAKHPKARTLAVSYTVFHFYYATLT